MKNVICLALAFGIFFAGCAEKQADPVIVSLTNQENPTPAIKIPVEPVTTQEVKTEDVAGQANKHKPAFKKDFSALCERLLS